MPEPGILAAATKIPFANTTDSQSPPGLVRVVHVIPSGEVIALSGPTATNVPLPNVIASTLKVLLCVQVIPSGEVIVHEVAIAIYIPFPCITDLQL